MSEVLQLEKQGEKEGDPPDIFMKSFKKIFLIFALLLLAFPVRPAKAQALFLEMNGYYRLRYDYLYRLYPKNSGGEDIGFFVQRLRLEPAIVAEERVRIKSQIDVLDDMVLGNNSAPAASYLDHGLSGGNTATGILGDERDTLQVKRVWAEIDSPYGLFRLGRQPVSFGLQAFLNSGDGQVFEFGDSHYGETRDRIAYFSPKTIFLGNGELMLAYDKLIKNPYNRNREEKGFLGWLADPASDLDEYMISYVRKGTIWEAGAAASRQVQFQSKTRVWLFDLYGQIRQKYLYAAGEGRFTTGKTGVDDEKQDVNQVGGLLRGGADLVTEYGEFDFGLEGGYASGDGSGKGGEQTNFAPDYRVGILLYSEVMDYLTRKAGAARLTRGGIANSVYARPFFKYVYAPRVSVMAGVLWAYPDKIDHIIAGHDSWLGIETDAGVEVKLTRRSSAGLELGYLFTGDGLEGNFNDPFALRMKFQVVF
ncbi:MAG: hypothetical protein PHE84_10210 [bacterium]|nr:hypothetical protein [bacterium]